MKTLRIKYVPPMIVTITVLLGLGLFLFPFGLTGSEKMADYVRKTENEVEVMGPAKAGIGRINDIYRFIFYIKSNDKNILIRCKNRLEEGLSLSSRLQVYFDFNPLNPL